MWWYFLVGFSVGALCFSHLGHSARAILEKDRDWWRNEANRTLESAQAVDKLPEAMGEKISNAVLTSELNVRKELETSDAHIGAQIRDAAESSNRLLVSELDQRLPKRQAELSRRTP
jgi:hypothetical protein